MPDGRVDLVCFGEILWDIFPSNKVLGGAPFNLINRALALGLNAHVISSVGNDSLGQKLTKWASKKGNSVEYIQCHPTLPTGVVNIRVDPYGQPNYDILYPVAWDDIKIDHTVISLIKSSKCFVYSSLALRDERSRKTLYTLLNYASLKICDINLRVGHFNQTIIVDMIAQADILRMNKDELDTISVWMDLTSFDIKSQMKHLSDLYKYQLVIVTLGEHGAICYDNETWIIQSGYKVEIKDTVGAGDAFLASFIFKYLKEMSTGECLRFACVVGALTASKDGGTPTIDDIEISELMRVGE